MENAETPLELEFTGKREKKMIYVVLDQVLLDEIDRICGPAPKRGTFRRGGRSDFIRRMLYEKLQIPMPVQRKVHKTIGLLDTSGVNLEVLDRRTKLVITMYRGGMHPIDIGKWMRGNYIKPPAGYYWGTRLVMRYVTNAIKDAHSRVIQAGISDLTDEPKPKKRRPKAGNPQGIILDAGFQDLDPLLE
jgi:hypothetical protein